MKKTIIYISLILILSAAALLILLPTRSSNVPKNIIIMVFDSARADRFTPYGYGRDTTPFINEIAKEGVVFENAYSQASWTLPSVVSIFTGMYTDFHGALDPADYLQERFITLAQVLKNKGYNTAGAYRNRWLVPKKNNISKITIIPSPERSTGLR